MSEDLTSGIVLKRFVPEETYKARVYAALKDAITQMDIYSSSKASMIDERQLAEKLGVSRTPIREALAILEQEGFVKSLPRRGIVVLKKTRREMIEMIQAWAALESMAVRLVVQRADDAAIARLKAPFGEFGEHHRPGDHLSEYSEANLRFHQSIIDLSGSGALREMTSTLILHVRGIRRIAVGQQDRASRSIAEHLAIIDAIERRSVEDAERLSREHTLGLIPHVEQSEGIFA